MRIGHIILAAVLTGTLGGLAVGLATAAQGGATSPPPTEVQPPSAAKTATISTTELEAIYRQLVEGKFPYPSTAAIEVPHSMDLAKTRVDFENEHRQWMTLVQIAPKITEIDLCQTKIEDVNAAAKTMRETAAAYGAKLTKFANMVSTVGDSGDKTLKEAIDQSLPSTAYGQKLIAAYKETATALHDSVMERWKATEGQLKPIIAVLEDGEALCSIRENPFAPHLWKIKKVEAPVKSSIDLKLGIVSKPPETKPKDPPPVQTSENAFEAKRREWIEAYRARIAAADDECDPITKKKPRAACYDRHQITDKKRR